MKTLEELEKTEGTRNYARDSILLIALESYIVGKFPMEEKIRALRKMQEVMGHSEEVTEEDVLDYLDQCGVDTLSEERREAGQEFEEQIQIIEEALDRMRSILQQHGDDLTWERARSYWYAHIQMALRKETVWLGSSMVTAEDSLRELREGE